MSSEVIQVYAREDKSYPEALRNIYGSPKIIFSKGNFSLLSEPCISIVGSRKASQYALMLAYELAHDLAKRGFTIVSGLAFGIDSAAHKGALDAAGKTAAVLGSGLGFHSGASNNQLRRLIEQKGLVLTEYAHTMPALKYHFVARNRIVSGLSLGTIVVEAAEASGSLITADFAAEQGREVMACFGRSGTVEARGSNYLIKCGAHPVENADDVCNVLAGKLLSFSPFALRRVEKKTRVSRPTEPKLDKTEVNSHSAPQNSVLTLDEYMFEHQLELGSALEQIADEVLAGRLKELPGQRYQIIG